MEYKHFKVVGFVLLFLMLSFDVFVPASAYHLLFLNNWFVQIYSDGGSSSKQQQ